MSNDQPTLFELEVLTKYVKDGIECNSCGITQPVENFTKYHAEIKRICRSCRRNQRRTIEKLKKENVYNKDYNKILKACSNALSTTLDLSKFIS